MSSASNRGTAVAGRKVQVSRVMNAPVQVLWRCLTERELLSEWLMPCDFEAKVGHRFQLKTEPGPGFDGKVVAEVLSLTEPYEMSWSWRGGPIDTVVEFRLAAITPTRTRLTVVQSGFVGISGLLVSFVLRLGWFNLFIRKLPLVLRRLC